jgi:hypothetical protein
MPYYRAELREQGIKPDWDWSTQRFLNKLATAGNFMKETKE